MLGGRTEGGNSNVYMDIRGPLEPVQNTGAARSGPVGATVGHNQQVKVQPTMRKRAGRC